MKKILWALLLPLLLCAPALAQVTKGDSCAVQGAQTGCSPTVSGSNKFVLVFVTDDTATDQNFSVTVGGNSCTQLAETAGTGQYNSVHYCSNPADGTPLCDSNGGSGNSFLVCQVYYGVDISGTPYGTREGSPQNSVTVESASAATSNSGAIASQTNDMVVTGMSVNGSVTTGAQLALTVNGSAGTNEEELDAGGTASVALAATAGSATVTHLWAGFPANRRHSNISVNLRASGASSSVVPIIMQQ